MRQILRADRNLLCCLYCGTTYVTRLMTSNISFYVRDRNDHDRNILGQNIRYRNVLSQNQCTRSPSSKESAIFIKDCGYYEWKTYLPRKHTRRICINCQCFSHSRSLYNLLLYDRDVIWFLDRLRNAGEYIVTLTAKLSERLSHKSLKINERF